MPFLHQILLNTDMDFLQRIAHFWGIDLPVSNFTDALTALESGMQNSNLAVEVINTLPENARSAWEALLQNSGKVSTAQFTRQYGDIRVIGEARRKREQPDLNPASAAEALWYRGLIGRGFLNLPPEPQEYIYIPQEFLALFQPSPDTSTAPVIRPATDFEHKHNAIAGELILDRITAMLCEIRKGSSDLNKISSNPHHLAFCLKMFDCLGLLDKDHILNPERVKEFLEAPRWKSLAECFTCWRKDARMNDLHMLPGLEFEGTWLNDSIAVKELMLKTLAPLDPGTWWSISGLVSSFKERQPDFQRPAGDYDSWFIRRTGSDQYLRGFKCWDDVDGALLRYLISGPLHWLGYLDLGLAEKKGQPTAFRISSRAAFLSGLDNPPAAEMKEEPLILSNTGVIHLPHTSPRAMRYQIGRFGELSAETISETVYTLSARSLKAAEEQGLKASQLLTLLRHAQGKALPSSIVQLLERWDKFGAEVNLDQVVLLRVTRPEILTNLQHHSQASRLIQEALTAQIAVLKPGTTEGMIRVLADLGYLAESELDV